MKIERYGKRKTTILRLEPEDYDILYMYSKMEDISVNKVLMKAIQTFLNQLRKQGIKNAILKNKAALNALQKRNKGLARRKRNRVQPNIE